MQAAAWPVSRHAGRTGQATTFSLAEVAHDLGIALGPVSDDTLEDLQ
ncbi:hypothetical protein [Actinomyces wuliandei]|nr:hypothetical protein [Actinomyces wuliandei]